MCGEKPNEKFQMEVIRKPLSLQQLLALLPLVQSSDWFLDANGSIRRMVPDPTNTQLVPECPACAALKTIDPSFDQFLYPWTWNRNKEFDLMLNDFTNAADFPTHSPSLRNPTLQKDLLEILKPKTLNI